METLRIEWTFPEDSCNDSVSYLDTHYELADSLACYFSEQYFILRSTATASELNGAERR